MSNLAECNVLPFPCLEDLERKIVQDGEAIDRSYFVEQYAPLVRLVARKVYRSTPPNVEFDDLVSCGFLGLIDALEKFDPSRGVKFKTYAEHRIRGAILDDLRAQDWIPRSVRRKKKILESSMNKIERIMGRKATLDELKGELGICQQELHHLMDNVKPAKIIKMDDLHCMNRQDQGIVVDFLQKNQLSNPYTEVCKQSSRDRIFELMNGLSSSERSIINLYYFESKNLREISGILGITESRVSQLHMRAKSKMKELLKDDFRSAEDFVA